MTATGGTANGDYLTIWPAGAIKPTVSSLNFNAGQTIASHAITPVSTSGFAFYTQNGAHLVVDLNGTTAKGDKTYIEGDVMNAFFVFVKKFRNGTFRIGGLKQFDLAFSHLKKGSDDAFALYRFRLVGRCAKDVFEDFIGCGNVFYSNADMFNFLHKMAGVYEIGKMKGKR
mgnify:CR=1 FL=1